MHLSSQQALTILDENDVLFAELFKHGSLSVEMYKPVIHDFQQPHDRNEIYMIVAGSGSFIYGDKQVAFQAGDFLFVPAGMEHRFVDFTDDFATWAFFYGPKGGE